MDQIHAAALLNPCCDLIPAWCLYLHITFYICLTVKTKGIVINHRSHVWRHSTLFTQVMHVNKFSPIMHLPLEFKRGEDQVKAPGSWCQKNKGVML